MNQAIALHPQTQQSIDSFLSHATHAVGLIGPRGMGKSYLAKYLCAMLLDVPQATVGSAPYCKFIAPDDKGSIRIEHAKEIISFLRLKTTGEGRVRRIVVLEHADTMTLDAQNTLLKAIEEPPADTVFIFTIDNRTALLPTVLSRLQQITVHAPAEPSLKQVFQEYSSAVFAKAYILSGGKPGLFYALLQNDTEHPLVNAIAEAKRLLQSDVFTRLIAVDAIVKDKQSIQIVEAIEFIAESGLRSVSQSSTNPAALRKWTDILAASNKATSQLAKNGQPKLVLTNLFMHI